MYKAAAFLFLFVGLVTGGVVDPGYRSCGGGIPIECRIVDCGGRCQLQPGKPYDFEEIFMPSCPASSLTLKIEICLNGTFCMTIIDTVLPNSSVQPGFAYTIRWTILPNDQLSGQSVEYKSWIYRTEGMILEKCSSLIAHIL